MAKILSPVSHKGGVGNTTSVNAIATCLKHRDYRVLCVDFDPRGYLSYSLAATDTESNTIYDVLKRNIEPQYALRKNTLVDLLPANGSLDRAPWEFTGPQAPHVLSSCLKPILPLYDYLLLDSTPASGFLLTNDLCAPHRVLLPPHRAGYGLQGRLLRA